MPASSAIRASLRLSGQLPDQRSGTRVTARPDEQLGPNRPILSRFALYIATRSGAVVSIVIAMRSRVSRAERTMATVAVVPAGARALGQAAMSVPATMTAIAIRAPGGPDTLVPEQRPVPRPGEGEVLVKVAAAGVNRPDVMQRQGLYPPPKGATDIPGLEIAGEVVALGAGVKRWKLGDKVMALVVGGGYAEYCPAHESHALPVTPDLAIVAGAAIPETFFTVWHNAF